MLKRKIYDKLLDWKNKKSRECLLVQGARQIGKTFIIEAFGRRQYKSYVYLNFYQNPEQKRIFAGIPGGGRDAGGGQHIPQDQQLPGSPRYPEENHGEL